MIISSFPVRLTEMDSEDHRAEILRRLLKDGECIRIKCADGVVRFLDPSDFLVSSNRGIVVKRYASPSIAADVGNIVIHADHHGMGFTCEIDGQPVERLRSVTLRLEVDHANLVTIEVLPDHRKKEPSRNA